MIVKLRGEAVNIFLAVCPVVLYCEFPPWKLKLLLLFKFSMSINNCEYLVVFIVLPRNILVPSVKFENVTPEGKSVRELLLNIFSPLIKFASVIIVGSVVRELLWNIAPPTVKFASVIPVGSAVRELFANINGAMFKFAKSIPEGNAVRELP